MVILRSIFVLGKMGIFENLQLNFEKHVRKTNINVDDDT
jgi:hypothetical protein